MLLYPKCFPPYILFMVRKVKKILNMCLDRNLKVCSPISNLPGVFYLKIFFHYSRACWYKLSILMKCLKGKTSNHTKNMWNPFLPWWCICYSVQDGRELTAGKAYYVVCLYKIASEMSSNNKKMIFNLTLVPLQWLVITTVGLFP